MSGLRPGIISLSQPARAELTEPDDEKNIARFAFISRRGTFASFMSAGVGDVIPVCVSVTSNDGIKS